MITRRDLQSFRIATCVCCGYKAEVNPRCRGSRFDATVQTTTMADVWICELCIIARDMQVLTNVKPAS